MLEIYKDGAGLEVNIVQNVDQMFFADRLPVSRLIVQADVLS
jgi:hypothetical protein